MDNSGFDHTNVQLERTGRRGGCSCCGFTMLGFMAAPIVVFLSVFLMVVH